MLKTTFVLMAACLSFFPEAHAQIQGDPAALMQEGRFEEARLLIEAANPDDPITPWIDTALLSLMIDAPGAEAYGLQAFWTAESLAAEIEEWSPEHAVIFGGLGTYCFDQGDLECAEAYLKVAVHLSPKHETYRFLYGATLLRQGKRREALEFMPPGLRRGPPKGPLDSPIPSPVPRPTDG